MDQRVGVDELERGGEREHLAAGRARSRRRSRARAPAGCACRRPAASSASPPRGPSVAGLAGEAQARRGRPRPARAGARGSAAMTVSALAARAGPAQAGSRPARTPRSSSAPASAARRAHSSTSAAARSGASSPARSVDRGLLEPLDQARPRGSSAMSTAPFSRTERSTAARMPLTKPGRLGAAERLGGLDRLVDRALGRDRPVALDQVRVQHLQQRGAQDGPLQRRDAVDRPVLRVARDLGVELVRVVGGRVRERAGERQRRRARRRRRAGGRSGRAGRARRPPRAAGRIDGPWAPDERYAAPGRTCEQLADEQDAPSGSVHARYTRNGAFAGAHRRSS